jgi:formate-dependent nitrite reductase membrane component NrfD
MSSNRHRGKILLGRAVVEITGILFLFYANLLMGEFTGHSRNGKTLMYALHDIFTKENFFIGVLAATLGFAVFEWFRKKLDDACESDEE